MALERRTATMPMAHGLQSKVDPRALPPPNLSLARDIQFDEEGGIQPRGSFADKTMNIVGGGTLANPRQVVAYGDELLLFTATQLYSWSERDQGWVLKDTNLATVVTEQPAFVRTEEQALCDRAELAGVAVFAWREVGALTRLMIAAQDTVSGSVLLTPTSLGVGATRPRLLALVTRILLVYETGAGDLVASSIDPAALAASIIGPTTIISAAQYNQRYDMCASRNNPANAILVARRDITTSYTAGTIPELVTGFSFFAKVRSCDGAIAVASCPGGLNRMAVFRHVTAGLSVVADLLVESTMSDSTINVTIGPIDSTGGAAQTDIAAEFRGVAEGGGQFRCYVAWGPKKTTLTPLTQINFIDSAGTAGTADELVKDVGVASRAFTYNGRVFFWLTFGLQTASGLGSLQNVYLLYRDDGLLIAKAVQDNAGAYQQADGRLPGVQAIGSRFIWCGEQRRRIILGTAGKDFAARAPVAIEVEFDRDEGRRCAQLGPTLYMAGGQILQYDGEGLAEVGFHITGSAVSAVPFGAGGLTQGVFGLALSYRWDNAKGDRDRGALSIPTIANNVGAVGGFHIQHRFLDITLKIGTSATVITNRRSNATVEMWRTVVNPTRDSPLFLTTSSDPSVLAGANRYIPNELGNNAAPTYDDQISDATLIANEANPENNGVLESLAPPAASIIVATQDRLLLAGISGSPFQIRYSRLRGDSEVAGFNGQLAVELPPTGGAITALAFLNETLVAFCEGAVFALPNDGFTNIGSGDNYGPARLIASDIGAESQEAVAFTPMGLVFKSRKGWFVMADWGAPRYVGAAVAEFDDEPVQSIVVVESQHQVRILTDQRMLVWDYVVNQGRGEWAEWPIGTGLGATLWQGQHVVLAGGVVKVETAEAELVSRLAIGRTLLTSGSDTTDGATIVTASIAPLPFRPIFAAVQSAHGAAAVQPTASGCGLTWELVSSLPYNGGIRRVSVFKAMGGAPTPGAITFDFGGTVQTSFVWSVVQLDGASTDDTVLQVVTNTAVATTINATLAALEHPNNNMLVFVGNNQGGAVTVDPQFTELSDNQTTNGSHVLEVEAAANQTTCDPTWGVSGAAGVIALEVKAGGIGQVMVDTESSWIRMADLEGFQRIWWLMLLGELVSACRIRIRLKRDYDESVYFDDETHSPPGAIGGPLQVRHSPLIQQTEAIKVRITVVHATVDDAAPEGPGAKLTGLALEYGSYPGLFRGLPSNQRQ